MSLCPVCEAPLISGVCEVCGHALPVKNAPVVVAPLADLETRLIAEGPTPPTPFPELEPTRFAAAEVVPAWSDVEWERSQVAAVPDVVAGGLLDLDSGREAPDAQRTSAAQASVTCRYCRNVQAAGLLCERCGLRLPWNRPAARVAVVDEALVRCGQCGIRAAPGRQCPGCGSLLAAQL